MTTPEDVAALARQYGDEREAAARAQLDPQIATLSASRDDWKAQAEKALADYEAHMKTHAPVFTKAQQSVGIQVFPDRGDLSYGKDLPGTKKMLADLKIKKVRGGIGPATTQTVIDWYNDIYDTLGIEACLTVGKPRDVLTAAEWDKVGVVLGKMRGVEILCNWNEPNHNRGGTGITLDGWPVKTINHGAELTKRFGADYEIGSGQFWSGNKATHDADLKTIVAATGANGVKYKDTFETIVWHLYQSGLTRMQQYETTYRNLFGATRPIICSETGMSTAPNQTQGAASMTEAEQAQYIVQHINMYLNAGHRVYWFELRDEYDPAGTDREDWLGIFRHDGTPKPAVAALRDLLLAA